MYKEPKLEYYGTFRELTQIGVVNVSDGIPVSGSPGSVGSNFVCEAAHIDPVTGELIAAVCFST